MAGMLQIITYLLCVHLIYKGWAILQMAIMSTRPDRKAGIIGGTLAVLGSVILSGAFVQWIDSQAQSLSK